MKIEVKIKVTYPSFRNEVLDTLIHFIDPSVYPFDADTDTTHESFDRLIFCLRKKLGTEARLELVLEPTS